MALALALIGGTITGFIRLVFRGRICEGILLLYVLDIQMHWGVQVERMCGLRRSDVVQMRPGNRSSRDLIFVEAGNSSALFLHDWQHSYEDLQLSTRNEHLLTFMIVSTRTSFWRDETVYWSLPWDSFLLPIHGLENFCMLCLIVTGFADVQLSRSTTQTLNTEQSNWSRAKNSSGQVPLSTTSGLVGPMTTETHSIPHSGNCDTTIATPILRYGLTLAKT